MGKYLILFALLILGISPAQKAFAQKEEIAQLLLNVEKLSQFKSILKNMKQGYQILNGGYNTVKDLSEGNFSLHKTYLDGLLEVSPAIKQYAKVQGIIDYQIKLSKEYKKAYERFSNDKNFSSSELDYIGNVYGNIFKQSLRNLDELLGVITSGEMRMSDDERIEAIDHIYSDLEEKLLFLRSFNNQATMLSLQRSKARNEIEVSKKLNGSGNQ